MNSGERAFTRAKITVGTSIFEFEGTEEFVIARLKEYEDKIFKFTSDQSVQDGETSVDSGDEKPNKKRAAKRKPKSKATGSNSEVATGSNPDNPTLDKNLDTSGIKEFYARYKPSNHPEKILIFMRFLVDEKQIENPNTDQIYTCYHAVSEKPAAAFSQSFRDTSSKKHGYINYNSANNISLTFIGNRHFDHELKKASEE